MATLDLSPIDSKAVSLVMEVDGEQFCGDFYVPDLDGGRRIREGMVVRVRRCTRDPWRFVRIALIDKMVAYCRRL